MFKWFMLAVYVILLIYTMAHFHKGLEFITGKKRRYLVGMCTLVGVCCLTILVGRFLPAGGFRRHVIEFSNYCLGFWIYLVFFFALLDIALILRKRVWKKPAFTWHTATFGIILLLSAGLTVCGGIHARHVTVNTQNVTIHKSVEGMKEMKIVLVSDWHLGYSIGVRDMKRMVKKINEQNPDLVLVAGDIYDNEYEAIYKPEEVAKVLKGIHNRYGTYGVYGNHDVSEKLVGGFTTQTDANPTRDPRIDRMMAKAGITMLQDQVISVDGKIELVGRLDGEKTGYRNNRRESLHKLMQTVDRNKPVLVLNHEPEHLKDYKDAGVDLLMAGHTHAGQFFPLTIMRSFVWENYWGVEKLGTATGAVTSGVGVYGPPLRLLSNSEVMVLNVRFADGR